MDDVTGDLSQKQEPAICGVVRGFESLVGQQSVRDAFSDDGSLNTPIRRKPLHVAQASLTSFSPGIMSRCTFGRMALIVVVTAAALLAVLLAFDGASSLSNPAILLEVTRAKQQRRFLQTLSGTKSEESGIQIWPERQSRGREHAVAHETLDLEVESSKLTVVDLGSGVLDSSSQRIVLHAAADSSETDSTGVGSCGAAMCPSFSSCEGQLEGMEACIVQSESEGRAKGAVEVKAANQSGMALIKFMMLHDVYMTATGQVFNKTHVFNSVECAAHSKPEEQFSRPASTPVAVYSHLVNLLPLTSSLHDDESLLEQVTAELPILFLLSPLLPALRNFPLAIARRSLAHTLGLHILGVDLSHQALQLHPWAPSSPSENQHAHQLMFAKNLYLPAFEWCFLPSPPLWRIFRSHALLPPDGLPLLTSDWLPRNVTPVLPPASAGASALPTDWTVVFVHQSDRKLQLLNAEPLLSLLLSLLPNARLVEYKRHLPVAEAKSLFNSAALVIAVAGPALANIIFQPFSSALIELTPAGNPAAAANQPLPRIFSARQLAHTAGIHYSHIPCEMQIPNGSTDSVAIDCNLDALQLLLENVASKFLPEGLVPKGKPSDEATAIANNAVKSLYELDGELFNKMVTQIAEGQYNRTLLLNLLIPQGDTPVVGFQDQIPGSALKGAAAVQSFKQWMQCVREEGRWQYNATPRSLPWEYTGYMNLCDHRWETNEDGLVTGKADELAARGGAAAEWKVRETLKYEWVVPEGKCGSGLEDSGEELPSWTRFDAKDLCGRVERRGGLIILMVGDSLQEQFAATFANNMLWHYAKPASWAVNKTKCYDWIPHERHEHCKVYTFVPDVCPGLALHFVSNRFLDIEVPILDKTAVPWTEYRGLEDADVIILNRGAHFREDEVFVEGVKRALRFIRVNYPDKLIVYRNTPPGHADCLNISEPLTEPQDPATLPYNYDKFGHQNVLAKSVADEVGAVYMDVERMIALRADGHRCWHMKEVDGKVDCLHYCTPGPLDVWPQLLYNILLRLLPESRQKTPTSDLSLTESSSEGEKGLQAAGGEAAVGADTGNATVANEDLLANGFSDESSLADAGGTNAEGEAPEGAPVASALPSRYQGLYEFDKETFDQLARESEGQQLNHTWLLNLSILHDDSPLKGFEGTIPGSILSTPEQVAAFYAWLNCVVQEGRWRYNATPRALPWDYFGGYNRCDHKHVASEEGGLVGKAADDVALADGSPEVWKVRETLKYEWVLPEGKCADEGGGASLKEWAKFDGKDLCKRLEHSKLSILIIGDSINTLLTQTLVNNVLRHVPKPASWAVKKTSCYDWVPHGPHQHCTKFTFHSEVCPNLIIHFVANSHLAVASREYDMHNVPWVDYRALDEADVIILNRGAHYEPDELFLRGVKSALRFVRSSFPSKLLIYRNTPPGHGNCSNVTKPLEIPQEVPKLYNWDKFPHQNEIIRGVVEEVGAIYMDADALVRLRADGHNGWWDELGLEDCLHYCVPGPLDVWAQLLYNIFIRTIPSLT